MKNNIKELIVYTDGACSGNPGVGGWAFVIPSISHESSGFDVDTTNNRMEIFACIEALRYLSDCNITKLPIRIVTDSQYVVNTMTKGWKKNKNNDLWKQLESFVNDDFEGNVKFEWVKGHSTNEYNKRCDELAVNEYTKYKNYNDRIENEEREKEFVKYGKKETINKLTTDSSIDIRFVAREKYTFEDNSYCILYQCSMVDCIWVAEWQSKEILGGGSYSHCRNIVMDRKEFVDNGYQNLPF